MKAIHNIEVLLEPMVINGLTLANRVVMAPMTRSQSPNGIPGEPVAQYYKRRAQGGVGLIITEGTVVNHIASYSDPNVPHIYGQALAGWQRVVEEVHAAGGKIFSQLWHVGSTRQLGTLPNVDIPGYGPSMVINPNARLQQPPKEMQVTDIDEVIAAFAQAALDAKNTGFDGVEIHGAHGYLLDQFLWSYTNQRSDHFGGKELKNRAHFAEKVVRAVRQAVGNDYPVGFRLSQWKMAAYQAKIAQTPQELEQLLEPLVIAGVDVFHASTRHIEQAEFSGSHLNLAGWVKKITEKPVITVGGVGLNNDFVENVMFNEVSDFSVSGLDAAIARVANQEVDFVAVGRALLADPYWLQKIIERRFTEIKSFTEESLAQLY